MSKLSKTLTIKKGSTVHNVPFYTTQSEANQYGDCGTAIVDGTTAYYPLGVGSSADTGSNLKSSMTGKKGNTTYYFLTKGNGELSNYNLVLSSTTNQTITLKYKNRNYKDTGYETEVTKTSTSSNQTFSVRKGTTWTASIAGATNYNPGTLSASSGTITDNTTVSASEATLAAIVLTDSNYKMSDIYPSTYQTMTTVPDVLDTSNVTRMNNMFSDCAKLTIIPALNTSKVTDMNNMFYFCSSFTTVPELNTSNVTNMYNMFYNCTSLTTIPQLNTSKVTNMNNMFYFCHSLKTIPKLNTSKVTNMNNMFGSCGNLKTVPQLDTSKVTDMGSMFNNCASLTTISQLNTSKVTNMKNMFGSCTSLPSTFPWTIDCSSISDDYDMKNMFKGSSVTNVTLKNVNSSIRSKVTSSRLKGNNTLTIKFA